MPSKQLLGHFSLAHAVTMTTWYIHQGHPRMSSVDVLRQPISILGGSNFFLTYCPANTLFYISILSLAFMPAISHVAGHKLCTIVAIREVVLVGYGATTQCRLYFPMRLPTRPSQRREITLHLPLINNNLPGTRLLRSAFHIWQLT